MLAGRLIDEAGAGCFVLCEVVPELLALFSLPIPVEVLHVANQSNRRIVEDALA